MWADSDWNRREREYVVVRRRLRRERAGRVVVHPQRERRAVLFGTPGRQDGHLRPFDRFGRIGTRLRRECWHGSEWGRDLLTCGWLVASATGGRNEMRPTGLRSALLGISSGAGKMWGTRLRTRGTCRDRGPGK